MRTVRQIEYRICRIYQIDVIVEMFSHSLCHRMFCETHFAQL